MGQLGTAWRAFWQILGSADRAAAWEAMGEAPAIAAAPAPEPEPPPKDEIPADAVYTLVLLQREGRLIDFLKEDIAAYADAQVGAAVRKIHEDCQAVLEKHFGITAIRSEQEGQQVSVPESFDPLEIKIVGSAAGEPPFSGSLKHHGWRVTKVDFPERHAKLDPAIICPAEVEVKGG